MKSNAQGNRLLYQDTAFETIPHIELGKVVDNATLQRGIEQLSENPGSLEIGWLEDERTGTIISLDAEALDELRQVDDRNELDDDFSHAVVWTAREDIHSEEETTVHLLQQHEADRILASNLKTLLTRIHAYYQAERRRERLAADDPLRTLLSVLD